MPYVTQRLADAPRPGRRRQRLHAPGAGPDPAVGAERLRHAGCRRLRLLRHPARRPPALPHRRPVGRDPARCSSSPRRGEIDPSAARQAVEKYRLHDVTAGTTATRRAARPDAAVQRLAVDRIGRRADHVRLGPERSSTARAGRRSALEELLLADVDDGDLPLGRSARRRGLARPPAIDARSSATGRPLAVRVRGQAVEVPLASPSRPASTAASTSSRPTSATCSARPPVARRRGRAPPSAAPPRGAPAPPSSEGPAGGVAVDGGGQPAQRAVAVVGHREPGQLDQRVPGPRVVRELLGQGPDGVVGRRRARRSSTARRDRGPRRRARGRSRPARGSDARRWGLAASRSRRAPSVPSRRGAPGAACARAERTRRPGDGLHPATQSSGYDRCTPFSVPSDGARRRVEGCRPVHRSPRVSAPPSPGPVPPAPTLAEPGRAARPNRVTVGHDRSPDVVPQPTTSCACERLTSVGQASRWRTERRRPGAATRRRVEQGVGTPVHRAPCAGWTSGSPGSAR